MLSMADEECSSDCESGWTLYLADHSNYQLSPPLLPLQPSLNHAVIGKNGGFFHDQELEEEEEEEDLSMVSDASSGPPHFQEEVDLDTTYTCNNNGGIGHHLALHQQYQHQHQHQHQYQYQYQYQFDAALPPNRIRSSEGKTRQNVQDLPSFLDDTASSPFFNNLNNINHLGGSNNRINVQGSMENNVVDFSQGYSTTYFQGQGEDHYHHHHHHQHHFGFFHSSVPAAGTQFQENQYGLNWPGMR